MFCPLITSSIPLMNGTNNCHISGKERRLDFECADAEGHGDMWICPDGK